MLAKQAPSGRPETQECPDELQHPLVLDPLGDRTHQFVVIDPIEEFLQIEINAPAMLAKQASTGGPETMLAKQASTGGPETVAFGDIYLRLCYRLLGGPPRPNPLAQVESALSLIFYERQVCSHDREKSQTFLEFAKRLRYWFLTPTADTS